MLNPIEWIFSILLAIAFFPLKGHVWHKVVAVSVISAVVAHSWYGGQMLEQVFWCCIAGMGLISAGSILYAARRRPGQVILLTTIATWIVGIAAIFTSPLWFHA